MFLKNVFNFIKTYPGILSSLFLIVLIPLTLSYITFFITNSFQKNIDYNLQTKALLVENIFDVFAADFFYQPEILEKKIEEITKENSEISKLRILGEEGGEFKIIASQSPAEKGKFISDPSFALSWSQNQAIANLISENDIRFWKVTKPVYRPGTGEKIGLISLALSLQESDGLITRSIYIAYLIVVVAIILILFLIIQHTRLFSFVALSKKLQEIDKMKDEFIRMATHELQSPIVNIKGYIAALREEIDHLLNEEQKKYFSRIEISAKNLTNLIEDILEVSRIEQGRLDFVPARINPQSLIREVVEELKLKAEGKGLKLFFEEKTEPFYIGVNQNRLRQVLFNLTDNAVKYTLKGGIEIQTRADLTKGKCYIIIADSGLGISAENQKRLFEKFYRVKTKETAEIPGTGLGLWISKELCRKMGGEALLESIEGTGSKFTIIFPLAR